MILKEDQIDDKLTKALKHATVSEKTWDEIPANIYRLIDNMSRRFGYV